MVQCKPFGHDDREALSCGGGAAREAAMNVLLNADGSHDSDAKREDPRADGQRVLRTRTYFSPLHMVG